jgi:hypothetical protein
MTAADANEDRDPVVELYKRGIDVTLIRENLRRSVDESLIQLMALQRFAEELKKAGESVRPKQQ